MFDQLVKSRFFHGLSKYVSASVYCTPVGQWAETSCIKAIQMNLARVVAAALAAQRCSLLSAKLLWSSNSLVITSSSKVLKLCLHCYEQWYRLIAGYCPPRPFRAERKTDASCLRLACHSLANCSRKSLRWHGQS